MTRRGRNGGLIVDSSNTDGQAMVEVYGDHAILTVLPARGTFAATIEIDRESAQALAEELAKVAL